MPRPPKLPEKEVFRRIEERLSRFDRGPFQEQLARALACGPSASAWRSLAKKSPQNWAQAVEKLGKLSGYAERTESLNLTLDPQRLAAELTARHGPEKARELIQAAGLPASLIRGEIQGTTVECLTGQTTHGYSTESGTSVQAGSLDGSE